MALKVGELYAALTLATDSFKKGLDESHGRASKWAGKIGGVFKTAGLAIAGGLAIAAAAIVAIGIKSLGNAEEQERANARVEKAFGKSADAVNEWASSNARALGVADDALQTSVAKYGEWARNVGFSNKEAISQGEALAKRASEISLATGESYDEVFAALLKGAQGSTRGLKEFGVAVSPLAIQQEALRLGLIKSGEALDDQAKAAALNSIIMNQTAGFTKSAADAQGSMTDMTREAGVVIDEVMDAVGQVFMSLALVVLPPVLDAFEALAGWVTENMPLFQAIIDQVSVGVTAAFAWIADNVIPALGAAFQWFVENILPVLAAAFQWYTENILPALAAAFGFIIDDVLPALGDVFTWIVENILPPVQRVFAVFTDTILPALGRAFEGVQQWIKDNWPTISKIVGQVGGAVKQAFDIIAGVIEKVAPIIVAVGEVVFPIVGEAAGVLLDVLSGVFDAIGTIFQTAADILDAVVKAIFGSWEGMGKFFSNLFKDVGNIIKGGINFIIGLVNGMIRQINSIQIHIPKIGVGDVAVGPFDWNGVNLPSIPYLARGTRGFGGGWAVLGENGPELAKLPRGTDVYNAAQSRDMMGGAAAGQMGSGGGITQHIYGIQPGDVERETRRAIRRQALEWALEGK